MILRHPSPNFWVMPCLFLQGSCNNNLVSCPRPPVHFSNERLPLRLPVPAGESRHRPPASGDTPHEKRRDESDRGAIPPHAAPPQERYSLPDLATDLLRTVRTAEDVGAEHPHEHGLVDHLHAAGVRGGRSAAPQAGGGGGAD